MTHEKGSASCHLSEVLDALDCGLWERRGRLRLEWARWPTTVRPAPPDAWLDDVVGSSWFVCTEPASDSRVEGCQGFLEGLFWYVDDNGGNPFQNKLHS